MSKDCTIHRAYIHHKKGDGLVCFYFPPVSLKCTFWWEIYHHLECHDHNDMMGFGKSSISHGWNVGPLPLSEPRKVGMYFPHLNLSLGNPGCETRTYVEYIGNEVWLSDSCCQCQCLTQSHFSVSVIKGPLSLSELGFYCKYKLVMKHLTSGATSTNHFSVKIRSLLFKI